MWVVRYYRHSRDDVHHRYFRRLTDARRYASRISIDDPRPVAIYQTRVEWTEVDR